MACGQKNVTMLLFLLPFQNMVLQENSPGKDGLEYQLVCKVHCDSIAKNQPVKPLNIPFLFYNGKL